MDIAAEYLSVDYITNDKDKLQNAMAAKRRTEKFIRQSVEEYTSDERIDVLTSRILEAESGMKKYKVQRPIDIHPITAPEINAENPGRENIVSVKFAGFKTMNDNLTKTKTG